jgi:hypothetical protein
VAAISELGFGLRHADGNLMTSQGRAILLN